MPCPPSLGELAYLAYWQRWPALPLPWPRLFKREQQAWEAAARAAIAAWLRRQAAPANDQEPRGR